MQHVAHLSLDYGGIWNLHRLHSGGMWRMKRLLFRCARRIWEEKAVLLGADEDVGRRARKQIKFIRRKKKKVCSLITVCLPANVRELNWCSKRSTSVHQSGVQTPPHPSPPVSSAERAEQHALSMTCYPCFNMRKGADRMSRDWLYKTMIWIW